MSTEVVIVGSTGMDERIDRYLVLLGDPFVSRSQVQGLIARSLVRVNGAVCRRAATRLKSGDRIEVTLPEPKAELPVAQAISLNIVYEDDDLLVVDKPRGMVVHPAPGHEDGTLVNALLAHFPAIAEVGDPERPGIVHRLDKETSGLLVVAKTDTAYTGLIDQLKAQTVGRFYWAFVEGRVQEEQWTVDAPIARDPFHRQRMAVVASGKHAVTHFAAIERFRHFSWIRARLVTGRTHQIRVHTAHIGHPVVGDVRYGARSGVFSEGQALHAYRLEIQHPRTGRDLSWQSPLPDELESLKKRCERA